MHSVAHVDIRILSVLQEDPDDLAHTFLVRHEEGFF
jgi:hypothetical protein